MTREGPQRAALCFGVAVAIGLVGAGSAAAAPKPLAQSHFRKSAEHWEVLGDAESPLPVYHSAGGNPGNGYISARDTQNGQIIYWKAPRKFLGDKSAAYGGFLQFSQRSSLADNPTDAGKGLTLKGRNGTANAFLFPPLNTDWVTTSFPLTEGFFKDEDGDDMTKHQFKRVLASLRSITIQAEFDQGAETAVDLDEVRLFAP